MEKHLELQKINENNVPTSTYDRILDILLEHDGDMSLDNIVLALANISKDDIIANLSKLEKDGYVHLEDGTYLPTPQGYQYFKKSFNESRNIKGNFKKGDYVVNNDNKLKGQIVKVTHIGPNGERDVVEPWITIKYKNGKEEVVKFKRTDDMKTNISIDMSKITK